MRKLWATILLFSVLNYSFGFSMIEHYCLMQNVSFIETSLSPHHDCEQASSSVSDFGCQKACCKKDSNMPAESASFCSLSTTLEAEQDGCCTTKSSYIRIETGNIILLPLETPDNPPAIISHLFVSAWLREEITAAVFTTNTAIQPFNEPELALLSVLRI